MKNILAIRHVAFEHLGTLEPFFNRMGFNLHYIEAGITNLATVEVSAPDLLVVLGGPIGAYETDKYPWLQDELHLIERRLKLQRPLLGICLGAQLIAQALGSRVYPNLHKEIGWKPLQLTLEGKESFLAALGECNYQVLHWHGDTFELPTGAKLLASTAITENQAFIYDTNTVGLQFHLEIKVAEIEQWLIGHAHELAATRTTTLSDLRQDSTKYGNILASSAAKCLTTWLIDAGLY